MPIKIFNTKIYSMLLKIILFLHTVIFISITQAQTLPCGQYSTASDSSYRAFTFKNNNSVTILLSGDIETNNTFQVKNDLITIRSGLKLQIKDNNTLIGVDYYTKGINYTKTTQANSVCSSDLTTIKNESCYLQAQNLRAKSQLKKATDKYLQCCNNGDGKSCNDYAVMKILLSNNSDSALVYFTKACNLEIANACANLGTHASKKGKQSNAILLYKKACDLKHIDSCFKLLELKQ